MIARHKFYYNKDSIYVLLTDTGTLFTKLIKRFTSAPYNHASIALDAGLNNMYSFGRKQAKNPWTAGFVEEDVYEGTFRYFPNTRCVLLRLSVTRKQHDAIARFIWSVQQDRHAYRYNLVGLLGVLFKVRLKRKKAYFCSQFVAEALASAGFSMDGLPPVLATPDDFLRHPAFEIVYEGSLFEYPLLDRDKLPYGLNGDSYAVAMEPYHEIRYMG